MNFFAKLLAIATALFASSALGEPPLTPFPSPMGSISGGGGNVNTDGTALAGQVTFWTSPTTIAGSTGFTYDAVTGILINPLGTATIDVKASGDTETNLFVIDASGDNLGIGGLPNATDRLNLRFNGASGAFSEFRISRAAGAAGEANEWTVGISHPNVSVAAGSLLFRVAQAAPVGTLADIGFLASSVVAGTSPDVIIKASGNVGIGTPSPSEKLTVQRDSNAFVGSYVINRTDGTAAAAGMGVSADTAGDSRTADFQVFPTAYTGALGTYVAGNSTWFTSGAGVESMKLIIGTRADTTPQNIEFHTDTPAGVVSAATNRLQISGTEVTVNPSSSSTMDFRAKTATDASGIFLDASAETIDLVGGFVSTGCSIDALGNLSCAGSITGSGSVTGAGAATQVTFYTAANTIAGDAGMTYDSGTDSLSLLGTVFAGGGDAAATPNFFVEAGEGMYDCGTNCVAIAASALDILSGTATATAMSSNDTAISLFDSGTGQIAFQLDFVNRLLIQSSGHIASLAIGSSDAGTGTCSAVTVAGNDVRGSITATCIAAQTVVVNFGASFSSTPLCSISAANAAGGTTVVSASATTSQLTMTAIGATTGGQYTYVCIE